MFVVFNYTLLQSDCEGWWKAEHGRSVLDFLANIFRVQFDTEGLDNAGEEKQEFNTSESFSVFFLSRDFPSALRNPFGRKFSGSPKI
jgi:hypothetical protein